MDLENWQIRLESHFNELKASRAGAQTSEQLFALEHGLDPAALSELQEAIRLSISTSPPSVELSLPWVVYSAEIGYQYSGQEYWQTFEQETPGWRARGSRERIREGFKKFQRDFDGVTPTGRWAEHFSIIAWPITHGVLPKDLQRRLARMLHAIRHEFSPDVLADPSRIGELIGARGWHGSSRFEILADEPELIGRIALSLLFRERQLYELPILRTTVERIASDLEVQRQSREWLRGAQRSAAKVGVVGLRTSANRAAPSALPGSGDAARQIVKELGVEPSLSLAPDAAGWKVWLQLPNLTPLARRFPQLRDMLSSSPCTVTGSSGRPLAPGQLLRGGQRRPMLHWPRADQRLLQFRDDRELIRMIFSSECLLRPGPTWVFRVASDGRAYELRGRRLRPGHQYVLVVDDSTTTSIAPQVDLACEGAKAFSLELPNSLPDELVSDLEQLDLQVARAVTISPAGLSPAVWDDGGYGEWLAGENPCISVWADHQVRGVRLRMLAPGHREFSLPPPSLGAPVYVELPQLAVGAHILEVSIDGPESSEVGDLEVVIRPRRDWKPGITADGALVAFTEPPMPTLDQLWSGRVHLDLMGPQAANVTCEISMLAQGNVRLRRRLSPLQLPVTRQTWRRHFRTECRTQEAWQNAFDAADAAVLDFSAGDAGHFRLECTREFAPLRWQVRHNNKEYRLRLLDDRGAIGDASVAHYDLQFPNIERAVDDTVCNGHKAAPPGLYVAQGGEHQCAVIVPYAILRLHEMQSEPRVDTRGDDQQEAMSLLYVIDRWSHARHTGAELRWRLGRASLIALTNALHRVVGGEKWGELESAYVQGGRLSDLQHAIGHDDLGAELSGNTSDFVKRSTDQRVVWFAQQLRRFLNVRTTRLAQSEDLPVWISELALRLASDPGTLSDWCENTQQLAQGMKNLVHNRVVARAARFAVLQVDNYHGQGSDQDLDDLYPGWDWT